MRRPLTTEEFIQKAKCIHNDLYNYSDVVYINNHIKVKIICKEHGYFLQRPNGHLFGKGCPLCKIHNLKQCQAKTIQEFILDSSNIHHDRYDYSMVNYINSKIKIKILCKIHGIFEQTPDNHLQGKGCPKCNSSRGELLIENFLKSHNIDFIPQKRFDLCKNKFLLSFDFYLPNFNICIEFDGKQHFMPIKRYGGEQYFIRLQRNDSIKDKYCEDKGISLIRIPYTKIKDIEKILGEII